MIKKISHLVVLGASFVFSSSLMAGDKVPVAGEIVSHSSSSPYVEFNPHPTITGLFTPRPIKRENDDIYFSANEVQNDESTSNITAIGDVYIIRDDATLKADKVTYNQDLDVIVASGNVSLVDASDNVIYADEMMLHDKMSKGTLNKLKIIMRDESKVWASKFKTLPNDDKVMYNATYTPCDCNLDGDDKQKPLWQITADKIKHDVAGKNIYYRNAFLEIKDIPVFYAPFLSHPDPTVSRRSGFLMPTYGSSGYLDTYLKLGYFFAINEHSDLTVDPYVSVKKGFIPTATYRLYTEHGDMNFSGSVLEDDDMNKTRGHFYAKVRYELNENWLANLDAKYISDSMYLKDLSLPEKTDPWLVSNLRFEYFNGRDYADIESYYFKMISYDLLTSQRRDRYDSSYVLPLMNFEKYNQLTDFGLYARNIFNFASVVHDDEVARTQRGTMINELVLPYTSRFGEKMRLIGSVKSDFYYVDDFINANNEKFTGDVARIFPQLGAEWKLPFIKSQGESRQIIEPIIVGVLAPNDRRNNKNNIIPNEDSQNAFLDDVNILDLDRYSGYDRNDTGSRVSYGVNWSSYGNILGRTQVFVAQSYYFDEEDTFSKSLGKQDHLSDFVGRIYANPSDYLDLNYRFRLDKESLDIKYSEVGASFGPEMLKAYISYIYLNDDDYEKADDTGLGYGTGTATERHEIYASLMAKLTKDWSIEVYNRQDLSGDSNYSLEHGGSIIYEDECIMLKGNVRRYDSNDPSVENNYEFNVSFLLKTIGGLGSK